MIVALTAWERAWLTKAVTLREDKSKKKSTASACVQRVGVRITLGTNIIQFIEILSTPRTNRASAATHQPPWHGRVGAREQQSGHAKQHVAAAPTLVTGRRLIGW